MNADRTHTIEIVDRIWAILRPICVFLVSLLVVSGVLYTGYSFVYSRYIQPVDPTPIVENDDSYITVEIKSGTTVSGIATQLVEMGIVRNKGVFQYTAEFLSKGPKLQAGTYELSPKMSVLQIIDELSTMKEAQSVMRFTTIEGNTIEQMAESLVKQKALDSAERFLQLCKTGESFTEDYPFLTELTTAQKNAREYVLEGYLFPDTYEIYVGASEETIIRKMLTRMNEQLQLAYSHQGKEDAMSIDDIVTLASIVEKEAKQADFEKVAAVFINRLNTGMRLQSDVTIKYITGTKSFVLPEGETQIDSPYNTYTANGLPPSPICSPSKYALEAVLYPNEDYLDEMFYFCAGDPETGELVFAKTLEQHEKNVAKYRPLWIEYDQKQSGSGQ